MSRSIKISLAALTIWMSGIVVAEEQNWEPEVTPVVSEDQKHSNKMLLSALVHMAWKYTYKEDFEGFASKVAGSDDRDEEEASALQMRVDSTVTDLEFKVEYRF